VHLVAVRLVAVRLVAVADGAPAFWPGLLSLTRLYRWFLKGAAI